ncbi:MAG: LytTR family transcriptional regulator, partial [Proteobacteria bacterium]|nr:LytTR family transcriptional regulator [Pseudomonadota bacterium]
MNGTTEKRVMFQRLWEYWNTPADLSDPRDRFWIYRMVAGLAGVIVSFIYLFSSSEVALKFLLIGGLVSLVFGLSNIIFFEGAPYFLGQWGEFKSLTIGKTWILSFLGLVLGISVWQLFQFDKRVGTASMGGVEMLIKIFPIWFLIAFLLNNMVIKRKQDDVIQEFNLNNFSMATNQRVTGNSEVDSERDEISQRNLTINLRDQNFVISDIVYIRVEEHYCSIFSLEEGSLIENHVRSPLKEILDELQNRDFIQIHRSHAVNLHFVSQIKRKN